VKHFWDHRNELIFIYFDVVYLVSSTILNKMFLFFLERFLHLWHRYKARPFGARGSSNYTSPCRMLTVVSRSLQLTSQVHIYLRRISPKTSCAQNQYVIDVNASSRAMQSHGSVKRLKYGACRHIDHVTGCSCTHARLTDDLPETFSVLRSRRFFTRRVMPKGLTSFLDCDSNVR